MGCILEIRYKLQFLGDDADRNVLPAHDGAQSLEGITWSLSLLSNYMASGQVRHRGNLDNRIKLYISPPRRGSFITDVVLFVTQPENIFLTSVIGTYTVSTVGNTMNSIISYAFKKVCGINNDEEEQDLRRLRKLPSGDIEANLDAIEPSLKRAHTVIGEGANKLIIARSRTPIIELNGQTKAYVKTDIQADYESEHMVGVGALNVNQGSGRVYIDKIGKTVPFNVVKEPDQGTYTTLSWSLDRYARGMPSSILIRCIEVYSIDDRIKRLIVIGARKLPSE